MPGFVSFDDFAVAFAFDVLNIHITNNTALQSKRGFHSKRVGSTPFNTLLLTLKVKIVSTDCEL